MSLLKEHTEAGWRDFKVGERHVAERVFSRPGATASTIRVEADSASQLKDAVTLRQSQLDGADEEVRDVITNDGTLVTDAQHEALRAEGVTVPDAEQVEQPVPNEDEAKQVAGLENAGFNPETPYDPTEAPVDTPQVPADAADQGLSPEAISASETGSGSADTSTDPTAQAMPASFPPPEGDPAESLPEEDHPAVLADVSSDELESRNTPSGDTAADRAVDGTAGAQETSDLAGPDSGGAGSTPVGGEFESTRIDGDAGPLTAPATEQPESGSPLSQSDSDTSESARSTSPASPDEVDATDAARKAAAAKGLDLANISGTGKDGRVTKDDVDAATEQK